MKIAIITLPFNDNYGGILQGYALREYLRNRGHEVVHVEEKGNHSIIHWSSFRFYSWWYSRRLIREVFFYQDKKRLKINKAKYQIRRNTRSLRKFVKDNLEVLTVNEFKELEKFEFDIIIVGSDQIWRPIYFKKIEDAFLSFAEGWDIKKVAYAPSFGVEQWEYNDLQTKKCKQFIKQFDALSVREEEGVILCEEKFNVSVKRLLDPTMLLDKIDYKQLVKNNLKSKTNQLTTYILDQSDEKRKIVAGLISKKKYTHVELGLKSKAALGENNDESIEFWLESFMNAKLILTDSFHGCVFALLFHKPFVVFGNNERGISRFNSLLRLFGLEYRLVKSAENIEDILKRKIDWSRIDEVLFVERERSASFFKREGV